MPATLPIESRLLDLIGHLKAEGLDGVEASKLAVKVLVDGQIQGTWLTARQVSVILGADYDTILKYAEAGAFRGAKKFPFGWRIPPSAVRPPI